MSRAANVRPKPGLLKKRLEGIETDRAHHLTGPFLPGTPVDFSPNGSQMLKNGQANGRRRKRDILSSSITSFGLWNDVLTMKWMTVPESSLKLLLIPILCWLNWKLVSPWHDNPFEHLIFLSHPIPGSALYAKGYWDIGFILYHIIFWSFVRQSLTIYILHPLGRSLGIQKQAKLDRFGEQGYAIVYYGGMGIAGLLIMRDLPTWYFKTENFWLGYPHWAMPANLKRYYLMHSAYWSQQLIVLALRLEKPRKDFTELILHHLVTLWLIGWSYLINLTLIGNAIFITMDVSDTFLALAKTLNYIKLKKTASVIFAIFVGIWSYTRHWLNLVILYSVWTEFDLISEESKQWNPPTGAWLAPWMKYQVFTPILLLQLVNLFWYFLIWRILLRGIFSSQLEDERSDGEDEEEVTRKDD